MHGLSKTPRKIYIHWGQDEPPMDDGEVPVWIRDEWSTTEGSVKKSAAEVGDQSPVVFVFLPKHEADQIKDTLASFAAAEDTLRRPTPQTDEGKAAQRAMRTRLASDDERLTGLFDELVGRARVFMGGVGELTIASLRAGVEAASEKALIRLFPKFALGDNPNWGKVVAKARDGAPDALEAVGHGGDPTTHPVGKELLAAVSASGTKGADLYQKFTGSPFGWPKDAVNGAVLTLLTAGNIRAAQDGKELTGSKELLPTQIGKTTFYKEDEPPTMEQRLKLRGLLTTAAIQYEPGQEGAQIPALLQRLKDLAGRAGGAPPLPEPAGTGHLDALLALGGNQRFRAVANDHERLSEDLQRWRTAEQQREKRERRWQELQRLLRHAHELPVAATVAPAVTAIRDYRQLLDDPDPTVPLLTELASALREEVARRAAELASAQRAAIAELEGWDEWPKLDPADRETIILDAKLVAADPPNMGTEEQLLNALDAVPLSAWQDRISFVPGRCDQARQRAAKLLMPESVTVTMPPATIKAITDLDRYLDKIRAQVQPHLDAGKTVII
jgi:hypothetical protein